MNKKTLQLEIPEGYEIDLERSDLKTGFIACKEKTKKPSWRETADATVQGFYIDIVSNIKSCSGGANHAQNHNVFATAEQAKSALAMAQISQIMANDPRFGGPITEKEWEDGRVSKYTIERENKKIIKEVHRYAYHFLAFHTLEQCNLFMSENMDLIKEYYLL